MTTKIPPQATAIIGALGATGSRLTPNTGLWDGVQMVGTNGHQLTVLTFPGGERLDKPVMVSRDALETIKRHKTPKNHQHTAEFQSSVVGNDVVRFIGQDSETLEEKQVEKPIGNFVDYTRVIPEQETLPIAITIDAKLLKSVLDVLIAASGSAKDAPVPVTLHIGKMNKACTVEMNNSTVSALAVVMPMHSDKELADRQEKMIHAARAANNPAAYTFTERKPDKVAA